MAVAKDQEHVAGADKVRGKDGSGGGRAGGPVALHALVEASLEGMGYELVELERGAGGVLKVTLDTPGGTRPVMIDDCERVSRQLAHVFTVENVDYGRLEVGSPGVDRRLSRRRDFERFTGVQVDIRLRALLDGRRNLRGRLAGVGGDEASPSVRLELAPPRAPGDGARRRAAGKAAAGKVKGKANAVDAAPPQVVELALSGIESARLVPELNFRGMGRDASK